MISIRAAALGSPFGDLDQTFAALAAQRCAAGTLPGPLAERLSALIATGPWTPQLLLIASTKGDGPLWIEDCLGNQRGEGGPGWLAQQLGQQLGCPAMAVSVACASGPAALAVAAMAITYGGRQRVLVVGGDRLMPMIVEGFAGLKALDPDGAKPFDSMRQGLELGETVAALWCEAGDAGPCYIAGWGLSCDANHLTGPHREGAGLAAACRQAMAGQTVDAVIAHGTGTRYNDDAESHAYAAVCPDAAISAWKGSLGHSLGACGLTEVALATQALASQSLPGICRLRQAGVAQQLNLLPPGLHQRCLQRILSSNAGFGGLNGAVVISHQPPPPTSAVNADSPERPAIQAHCLFNISLASDGWCWQDHMGHSQRQPWPFSHQNHDGTLPRLSAKQVTGHIDASWGRMDLASRLVVSLALLAQQSGTLAPFPADTAMVLLSDRGCAESDRACELARQQGSSDPQRFAYTLPSTPLGELSIRCGLRGAALALPGASDEEGREVAQWLLQAGHPMVLLLRVEADQAPHVAWLEVLSSVTGCDA